jgi:DNA-directed RNA polymerase subunit RPC12/RpoP
MVSPRAPSPFPVRGFLVSELSPGEAQLRSHGDLHGSAVTAPEKPKRNWIQEERRRTLGDWVAWCLSCGFTVRYFDDLEAELPPSCPQCTGELRNRCAACGARFPSAFQVECDECGREVRPPELFGTRIRKPRR